MTTFEFSDELVLSHVLYEAHGAVPLAWRVFVLKDLDALNTVREAAGAGTEDAYAWTQLHSEPDAQNAIGIIYLAAGWIYVGMVAHEVLHLASWMCRFPTDQWPIASRTQTRPARMTMGREPEHLAEIVGQLTSVIWYNLEAASLVDVDELEPA